MSPVPLTTAQSRWLRHALAADLAAGGDATWLRTLAAALRGRSWCVSGPRVAAYVARRAGAAVTPRARRSWLAVAANVTP